MQFSNLAVVVPLLGFLAIIPTTGARFDADDVPIRRIERQVQNPSYSTYDGPAPTESGYSYRSQPSRSVSFPTSSADVPPTPIETSRTEKDPSHTGGAYLTDEASHSASPVIDADRSGTGLPSFPMGNFTTSVGPTGSGLGVGNGTVSSSTLEKEDTETVVHMPFSSVPGVPAFTVTNSSSGFPIGTSDGTAVGTAVGTGTVMNTIIRPTPTSFRFPESISFNASTSLRTEVTTTATETILATVILTAGGVEPTRTGASNTSIPISMNKTPSPWKSTTIVVVPTRTDAASLTGAISIDPEPASTCTEADATSSEAWTDVATSSCADEQARPTSIPDSIEPPVASAPCLNETITIYITVTPTIEGTTTCLDLDPTYLSSDDVLSTISDISWTEPMTTWESPTCSKEDTIYTTIWTVGEQAASTPCSEDETVITLNTEAVDAIGSTLIASSSELVVTTTIWENTKPVAGTTSMTSSTTWAAETSTSTSDDPTILVTVWQTISSCTTTSTWTHDGSTEVTIVTFPTTLSTMTTSLNTPGTEVDLPSTFSSAMSSAVSVSVPDHGSRWGPQRKFSE